MLPAPFFITHRSAGMLISAHTIPFMTRPQLLSRPHPPLRRSVVPSHAHHGYSPVTSITREAWGQTVRHSNMLLLLHLAWRLGAVAVSDRLAPPGTKRQIADPVRPRPQADLGIPCVDMGNVPMNAAADLAAPNQIAADECYAASRRGPLPPPNPREPGRQPQLLHRSTPPRTHPLSAVTRPCPTNGPPPHCNPLAQSPTMPSGLLEYHVALCGRRQRASPPYPRYQHAVRGWKPPHNH
jgi:hypothetical protein